MTPKPTFQKLPHRGFGIRVDFGDAGPKAAIDGVLQFADVLLERFADAGGLIVIKGLSGLKDAPEKLLEISTLFGPEVENVHQTLTAPRFFHEVPEIMVLSNKPPCLHPPPPKPPAGSSGEIRVQFPDQINWHTDQSYRRPPPDVSLLFSVTAPPADQGQTLYANCTAAYESLDAETCDLIDGLVGIHAPSWIGRTPWDVRDGVMPDALLPHQMPQPQPLVRVHPDTGKRSLYVCEEKQMDYVDGPIVGFETGPDGDGAALVRQLLIHITRPVNVYVHEWAEGDLVIGDNRCLLHCATWYDAETHAREMWRTTVMGNPGKAYAGEAKSWIPADGIKVMQGMERA